MERTAIPGVPLENVQLTPEVVALLLQMQQHGMTDAREVSAVNRGTWNQTEDEQLMRAVAQLGSKKWTDIAKLVPNRTSKQCRERWCNRLAPQVKHEPFDPWEDAIIVEKQKEMGNRWSAIAKQLPGRCPNAVKNRWYSGLKAVHQPHFVVFGQAPLYGELMQIAPFARGEYRDHNPLANDL